MEFDNPFVYKKPVMIKALTTFSGGKDDSSPSCQCLSVMTSTNDEVRHDYAARASR